VDRTGFIGGSDMRDLFNIKPYGCKRRLWYEKRGEPADYQDGTEDSYHIRRGNMLEDFVARLYAEQRGRKIRRTTRALRDKEHPYLRGHVDREILVDGKWQTPLEIKNPSKQMYLKMQRDGLAEDYILQVQHYIGLKKAPGAAVAVFSAEMAALTDFEIASDPEIQTMCRAAAIEFWEQCVVGDHVPERLEVRDPRCATCAWRRTCQGAFLEDLAMEQARHTGGDFDIPFDEALAGKLHDYFEMQKIAEEAERYLEEIRDGIRVAMGNRPVVETQGARVYYRVQTAQRWDVKRLEKEHPELKETYKGASQSRPLRIFSV
jgi:predicted phage-related endonuclease